ncbi:4-hydroxybenzoate octaprenyltransferase [Pyruvatibacter mobilis]|uniref:4-hydroxybenzoate octaprenyltransferase n=1 Tax=Pyruvatibacter mobilis TaxID=1712261 RepID=UPI003BB03201
MPQEPDPDLSSGDGKDRPPARDQQVADAAPDNWVDLYAPRAIRPYLRLMRADRPVGTWLLFWPCAWSITLAAPQTGQYVLHLPILYLLVLFLTGAFVMRGAGCVWNDITDREFDARVARTASRPIPSGQVSVTAALVFLASLLAIGFLVLIQLTWAAIGLGVGSLALVAIYPFAKRFTWWPQIFLGLAINWGALMGWAAVTGSLSWAALCLYLAGIAWTLGYDTIYAHQDKEDDALIGVKSTALRLGGHTKAWLWGFYGATLLFLALAGIFAGIGWVYFAGLLISAFHLMRQVRDTNLDTPDECLAAFKSNRDFGAIIFAALLAGTLGSSV